MSVIEKEIKFNTSVIAPSGATVGKIMTAGFHTWGVREYLDFYPIDLAIPSSALPDFCKTLDKAVPGDYLSVEGITWGNSYESYAVMITPELLSTLSWHIALKLAAEKAAVPSQEEQRKIIRDLLSEWSQGSWPFNWKR